VNATVRANILFGTPYDAGRYAEVIAACCLEPDLATLAAGDLTEIGEQGINLSGGQRQRVSLARAVYSRSDIVLLDDVLSAVDAHVGAHIFKHCIQGLLSGRTVVIVTHAVQYLPKTDRILVMDGGVVVEEGPYAELVKGGATGALRRMVETYDAESTSPTGSSSAVDDDAAADSSSVLVEPEGEKKPEDPAGEAAAEEEGTGQLTEEEARSTGHVDRRMYLRYFQAAGVGGVSAVVALFMLSPLFVAFSTYWLAIWTEQRLEISQLAYLGVYALISLGSLIFIFVRQGIRAVVSVRASASLHRALLKSLLRAPLSFFHTTPQGRILNRFSNDMGTVDEQIFDTLGDCFRQVFKLVITIVVIMLSSPWFLLCVPFLMWLYYRIQAYYIPCSRELKRLETVTKSPIFSQFSETLSGIVTIRAFGAGGRFGTANAEYLDINMQSLITQNVQLNRWLMFWTQVCAASCLLACTWSCSLRATEAAWCT
jgi:ATP-binding cassette subfamily C (CFTR/MRP) protein 1